MDKETIFNIFPICNADIITHIGFRVHEYSGNDEDKTNFLLSRVDEDSKEMALIEVSENYKVKLSNGEEINGLTHERFNNLSFNGTTGVLYEPFFHLFNAPEIPLTVVTMVVDGEIKITKLVQSEPKIKTPFTTEVYEEVPEYYLSKFMSDEGFNMGQMIHADFLDAIKTLFKDGKYVSSLKLLLSAIDTIAFLDFGDVTNNFKMWVSKYCIISKSGLSEEELWEYRNSILHMTNSYSRKVLTNKVNSLSFYVNNEDIDFLTGNETTKYFNFKTLYDIVLEGIDNWSESYNMETDKFQCFCDRYDLIISDSRYGKIK